MASPLTADALVRALRNEGVKVVEHSGWRTNNRNSKGAWGPVNGVMIHHTVTSGTDATVRLCFDGRSDLPGPLCHGVIAKDGTVHLVGNGRANHAGLGDDDVLRAVIAESAGLPAPNENNTDGNARFYGFECVNLGDGKDPWPAAQLEAIEAASAALCRAHRWSARSVIAHKEWTNTKIDPRGFSMATMRERIASRLGAAVPTPPPQPVVDLSRLVAAAKADPPASGTPVTYSGVKTVERALVAEGLLAARYADGHYGSQTVTAYAAWQRRCGYSGADADGIPGMTTLRRLGAAHGFTVQQ
ncbi:N-acetylmuramoyl-L-alanine amidase [Streptomyces sp. UH6]|uniref:N-acetylmuramoyl-L-alanine amidase n=1 Tax=Streptomyces sp. UH6 TaxID=2748379 RepID=UPI0015D5231F|nr:N-acetylmuramoyl-L-alanine amidase [Streptomyces sp. UH6]NYV73160.1 N-acetylmuramoyl-L-alanine amidase [Streptomyces sp. UH6]